MIELIYLKPYLFLGRLKLGATAWRFNLSPKRQPSKRPESPINRPAPKMKRRKEKKIPQNHEISTMISVYFL